MSYRDQDVSELERVLVHLRSLDKKGSFQRFTPFPLTHFHETDLGMNLVCGSLTSRTGPTEVVGTFVQLPGQSAGRHRTD